MLFGREVILSTEVTIKKRGRKRRILFVAASILLLALGITAIVGGAVNQFYNMGTDADGYSISEAYPVRTSANAYTMWVNSMRMSSSFSWLGPNNIAQTKWVVTNADPNKEIFVGWVKSTDGEAYIRKFSYETPDQVWHWYIDAYYAEIEIPSTTIRNQGTPPRPPAEESFWMKSATTKDSSTIYWDPVWDTTAGMNMLVIMNADGSSNVNADIQLGFRVPILGWLPYLLIPLGILLLLGAVLLFKRGKKS